MNGVLLRVAGALLAISAVSGVVSAETVSGPVRLIDGDTLEISGTVVRLHGIDAPETGQSCTRSDGRRFACGLAALDGLRAFVAGQSVTCEGTARDRYGRLIGTCYAGAAELNRAMVRAGLAMAFRRYSEVYLSEEVEAFKASRGLWSGNFDPPWEVRKTRWDKAARDAPDGCPIKGNISARGRIYHLPYSRHYTRTRIDPARGERWFCSETEAIAAGWRAPYR